MRWSIALTAAGVLWAAGIAVSQQPPGGSPPHTIRAATPPRGDVSDVFDPYAQVVPGGTGYGIGGPPGLPYGVQGRNPFSNLNAFVTFDADPEASELKQIDQQLEQESRRVVSQLAQSPEDDVKARDDLKQKLREKLDKQFEAQQKLREIEITRIEERVNKLRDVVNKRNAARRTIVDRRQQQLIDEAEGYGWSSAGAGGAPAAMNLFEPLRFPADPNSPQPNPAALGLPTPGGPRPNSAAPAAVEAPAALPNAR